MNLWFGVCFFTVVVIGEVDFTENADIDTKESKVDLEVFLVVRYFSCEEESVSVVEYNLLVVLFSVVSTGVEVVMLKTIRVELSDVETSVALEAGSDVCFAGTVVVAGPNGMWFPNTIVSTTVVTNTIIQTKIAVRHRKYQSNVFRGFGREFTLVSCTSIEFIIYQYGIPTL